MSTTDRDRCLQNREYVDRSVVSPADTFKNRSILVRGLWWDITPESHNYTESYSDDGGKTWRAAFIAHLTRIQQQSISQVAALPRSRNALARYQGWVACIFEAGVPSDHLSTPIKKTESGGKVLSCGLLSRDMYQ